VTARRRLGRRSVIIGGVRCSSQWETSALVTALQQGWGRAPVTRRLLLVAAAVAVVGLMTTLALEETAAGGWFNVPGMAAV
jgi:hypothetical protein